MQDLKISLIQTDLVWENSKQNLLNLDDKLSSLDEGQDLIILPEMFNTGFSLNPSSCAEEMSGNTVDWLLRKSEALKSCITGSISIKEGSHYYNRLIWVTPNGIAGSYDKKHLFRFAGEDRVFCSGNSKTIFDCKGWNILPLICYDLRFPVWSMNTFSNEQYAYDCIVYVANWPEKRRHAWLSLLVARAIENQSYVIGVNRVGVDSNGRPHSGDSIVVNPYGEIISSLPPHAEACCGLTLQSKDLLAMREQFPFARDWDSFTIIE